MTRRRDDANRVLKYYIRTAWEAAGLKWNINSDIEIEDLITDIIDEAVEEAAKN